MAQADYRYGTSQPGTKQFAGFQSATTYPSWVYVYFNTTSITLDWTVETGVTSYQIQVSETQDFSGTLMVNTTVAVSGYSFTDSGTDDTKRWWRWRSWSSGTWSAVGSYWINTSGANNILVARNTWKMFDPDDVTDIFTLPLYPMNTISNTAIERLRTRNRQGTLLSEYLTTKAHISFDYNMNGYLEHKQYREHIRFNEEIKTLFVTTFKDNDFRNPVPNIWKVQYEIDPIFSMIAMGRPDLMAGSINFEEV